MQTTIESLPTSQSIQQELLSYLEEHPNASDTAEGIRQWWLIKRIAEYSQVAVQSSLDQLVAKQALKKRSSSADQVVYVLNKQ
jgi:hypothetical protein